MLCSDCQRTDLVQPTACQCDLEPRHRELRLEIARARDDGAGMQNLLILFGLFAGTFAVKAIMSEASAWFWLVFKAVSTSYFWWIIAHYRDAQRRLATAIELSRPPVACARRAPLRGARLRRCLTLTSGPA
jgi:hypothetical protein